MLYDFTRAFLSGIGNYFLNSLSRNLAIIITTVDLLWRRGEPASAVALDEKDEGTLFKSPREFVALDRSAAV